MTAEVPASNLTRLTLPQVSPLSDDVAVSTPLSLFWKLTDRPMAYAVPSGPMDTQGSDARVKQAATGFAGAEQASKGRARLVKLCPPLVEREAGDQAVGPARRTSDPAARRRSSRRGPP